MPGGPQPVGRARRLEIAFEIAEHIHRFYRDQVLAIGVYGSLARGTDGPYSDIEMHCVLRGEGFESTHEWSAGPWKAEVNVYSEDIVLRQAAAVDVDWPLTHGSFTEVLAIYDPDDFFSRLRVAALSQPDQAFQQAIHDVIVGELYERVGKVRNAAASQDTTSLPYLTVGLVEFGACLIALANRYLYASGHHFLTESRSLPNRPQGYDALCQMVTAGQLADPCRIGNAVEAFWIGIECWAQERQIQVEEELVTLLSRQPRRRRTLSRCEKAISFVQENGNPLDRLRLRRALGEPVTLAEAEVCLSRYQCQDGSFDYNASEGGCSRVGSLGGVIHCLRWVREFGLGDGAPMVRTLDFLAAVQGADGSFYETEAKLAHSPQAWLNRDTIIDRFYFTAAVPVRLISLGYTEHPMIGPALKWLRRHWSDWRLVTSTQYNLWALLCLAQAPLGLSSSLYQRCYATALEWLEELNAGPLTWLLDALQGAGFLKDAPLVAKGLDRLSSLQGVDGVWPDQRAPVETTVSALRLLRDYGAPP